MAAVEPELRFEREPARAAARAPPAQRATDERISMGSCSTQLVELFNLEREGRTRCDEDELKRSSKVEPSFRNSKTKLNQSPSPGPREVLRELHLVARDHGHV